MTTKNKQYDDLHKYELNAKARETRLNKKLEDQHQSLLDKQKQDNIDANETLKYKRCKRIKSILEFRKWLSTKKEYKLCENCLDCRYKQKK